MSNDFERFATFIDEISRRLSSPMPVPEEREGPHDRIAHLEEELAAAYRRVTAGEEHIADLEKELCRTK